MLESPLLRNVGGYIGGRWVVSGPMTFTVVNPATGEPLATVPDLGAEAADRAVEAAAQAQARPPTVDARRGWLVAIHDALLAHRPELARIITLEQGKPLKESLVEVEYAAGFFKYFASILDALAPRELPQRIRNARWTVHHRPTGMAALITPWNFPIAMLAKKLAPALAAGCATITKPADLTPLTSVALWHLLESIGLPPGWANLIVGRPAPIGRVLCEHPSVRLISFTGSTEVGRTLAAQCAPHVKRLALELGGNAPFIVMDDADLRSAVDALMANKFRCAGQTCVCANRVLVQRGAVEPFTRLVAERVARLKVGDGQVDGTDIGPLINASAVAKVRRHVDDAVSRGARVVASAGNVDSNLAARGNFFPPCVLTDLPEDAVMLREETFGPVVGVAPFDTDEQAVERANGTLYGLAAYLFTGDHARAERLAARLQFGHVGVNTATGPTPEAPFGGFKQSGFGREGGLEGLLEFTEPQTVVRG